MATRIARHGLILFLWASLTSCGFGHERWEEEVQLGDNRTIKVFRELVTESGGDEWAINRSGIKPKEYRVRFEFPENSGKMVEWVSTKRSSDTWPEKPLVLDIESGQPTVFSIVGVSLACEIYSKYRYANEVWTEVDLPEVFQQHETNLFIRAGVDMPPFVSLDTKRKVNRSVDFRRSLKRVGPSRKVCE